MCDEGDEGQLQGAVRGAGGEVGDPGKRALVAQAAQEGGHWGGGSGGGGGEEVGFSGAGRVGGRYLLLVWGGRRVTGGDAAE